VLQFVAAGISVFRCSVESKNLVCSILCAPSVCSSCVLQGSTNPVRSYESRNPVRLVRFVRFYMPCGMMWCGVMQCDVVRCSMVQFVAVCNVLQLDAVCCSGLDMCCSCASRYVLQCVAA